MPNPVYILCCHTGTEDKLTGLLSHYNVLEKFLVFKIDKSKDSVQPMPGPGPLMDQIRVVSVWMKAQEDSEEDEFEYTVEAIIPPNEKHIGLSAGKFKFTKPLHRITLDIRGQVPIEGPGLLRMECNIRKAGSDTWMTQSYPIVLEELNLQQHTN